MALRESVNLNLDKKAIHTPVHRTRSTPLLMIGRVDLLDRPQSQREPVCG